MNKLVCTSILMLAVALFQMPYGYYQLLKFVIFITAGFVGYNIYKKASRLSYKVILQGLILLVYNPIIRIHFEKDIWQIINIVTIFILATYLWNGNKQNS